MKDTKESAAELANAFFCKGFVATHYAMGQMPGEWMVVDKGSKQVLIVWTNNGEVIDGYDYEYAMKNYESVLKPYDVK